MTLRMSYYRILGTMQSRIIGARSLQKGIDNGRSGFLLRKGNGPICIRIYFMNYKLYNRFH
jgi:hypothetical protein